MDYNLVLHIDSKDAAILQLLLRNAANYLGALPNESFELVIVANGPAVLQFLKAEGSLEEKSAELATKGVKFRLCANALKDNGIKREELWPFCGVVPAGLVEIVRLQKEGYAYIKP